MLQLLNIWVRWIETHKFDRVMLILVCLVMCGFNWHKPLIFSPDSETYIKWASLLINHDFNIAAYLRDNSFFTPSVFYITPVIVIGVLKSISPDHWQASFHTINVFALAICLFAYYRVANQLLFSRPVKLLSLGVCLTCADLLIWPHYMLSDTLFAMIVMVSITLNISRSDSKVLLITSTLILLLMLVTRPSSIPFVGAAVLFFTLRKINMKPRGLSLILGFMMICAATLFIIIVSFGSVNLGNPQIDHITILANNGIVIHDRPDTWVNPPETLFDLTGLFLFRICYFMMPFHVEFSIIHNFLNGVSLGYIIIGITLGAILGIRKNSIVQPGSLFLILLCLCVILFHASTIIDYDWRYRFPIILPLTLLATIGFQTVHNYYSSREALKL